MTECVWSIGRIILIGENKKTQKNLTQCHSVHHKSYTDWPTSEPERLWWKIQDWQSEPSTYIGKWPKNAFYCTDQSRCVVLHVACVTNTGCVLFERLGNRSCHTVVVSEVGYICQISHIQYLD